jgi:hypothetical protein
MQRQEIQKKPRELLCPSAQPAMEGGQIFGIAGGTAEVPRITYLDRPIPITPEIASLAHPVEPDEVFRVAARCAEGRCVHFSGSRCELGQRAVMLLQPVVSSLPPCAIRPRCRWFAEQGRAACMRCPQIVTRKHGADPAMVEAAGEADVYAPSRT